MANLSDYFPSTTNYWNDAPSADDSMILNFNGTDGSTTITDDTGLNTMTAVGNAQLDTADKKFGTASLLLDGAGDYVTTPYVVARHRFWNDDFTLDCWVKASSWTGWSTGTTIPCMIGCMNPTANTNYWSFGPVADGRISLYHFSGTAIFSTGTLSTGVWHHIMMQYVAADNAMKLAIDGQIDGFGPRGSTNDAYSLLTIGQYNNAACTGQIDALRMTMGTARFGPPNPTSFTPPTQEPG